MKHLLKQWMVRSAAVTLVVLALITPSINADDHGHQVPTPTPNAGALSL